MCQGGAAFTGNCVPRRPGPPHPGYVQPRARGGPCAPEALAQQGQASICLSGTVQTTFGQRLNPHRPGTPSPSQQQRGKPLPQQAGRGRGETPHAKRIGTRSANNQRATRPHPLIGPRQTTKRLPRPLNHCRPRHVMHMRVTGLPVRHGHHRCTTHRTPSAAITSTISHSTAVSPFTTVASAQSPRKSAFPPAHSAGAPDAHSRAVGA